MKNTYLPFEKCIDRLRDSFISEYKTYQGKSVIDFQHPSIRDMILSIVQGDPVVRARYVGSASPEGVLTIIEGLTQFNGRENRKAHALVLQNGNELEVLCNRIRSIINEEASLDEIRKIIMTMNSVVREKERGHLSADIQVMGDEESAVEIVARTIIDRAACSQFFNRFKNSGISIWTDLLCAYYLLTANICPDKQPAYLHEVVTLSESASIKDCIEFLVLLQTFALQVFEDIFSPEFDEAMNELVVSGLRERCDEGHRIESSFEVPNDIRLNDFDYWHYDGEEYVEAAYQYYKLSQQYEPDELFELNDLLFSVNVPDPSDDEPDEVESKVATDADFWTISRLFEDL